MDNLNIESTNIPSKQEIKKKRVIRFFIDAAKHIIEKEGIDKVTIYSVSDLAGYSSASLYNYFQNIDELIGITATELVQPYVREYINIYKSDGDSLDKYIRSWICLLKYSLSNPELYFYMYTSDGADLIAQYAKKYYKLFPLEDDIPSEILSIHILQNNAAEQEEDSISYSVKDGFFSAESATEIWEYGYILYKGILADRNSKNPFIKDDKIYISMFVKRFIGFIKEKLEKDKDLSEFLI